MQRPLHPLNAVLLAGTTPLLLGVLLSDLAFSKSYEIPWKTFRFLLLVGVSREVLMTLWLTPAGITTAAENEDTWQLGARVAGHVPVRARSNWTGTLPDQRQVNIELQES